MSSSPTGAGTTAAQTAAEAARLVGAVARGTEGWDGGAGVAAQANALAARLDELATEDAEVFVAALNALATRSRDLPMRMERAAEVPLEIARTAADVCQAAALVAERCDGAFRADAAASAALASGAALAAAHLVRANLLVTPDDPRVSQAFRAAEEARDATARALDAGS
jgi:formiminotetrahydrofolate cyclodeaminase